MIPSYWRAAVSTYHGGVVRIEPVGPLLLDVCLESCQHLEINEAVARIGSILVQRLPVAMILIRRLDLQRSCLETVTAETCGAGPVAAAPLRSDCSPSDLQRLLLWCRRQEVFHGPSHLVPNLLPGLLPPGIEGDVLSGPLGSDDGPLGVLILIAPPGQHFDPEDREVLRTLLGPFTVALQND